MPGKYYLYDIEGYEKVESIIDILIEDFANKLKSIENENSGFGIGDAQTDEAIAIELYGKIHYEKI